MGGYEVWSFLENPTHTHQNQTLSGLLFIEFERGEYLGGGNKNGVLKEWGGWGESGRRTLLARTKGNFSTKII